MGSRLLDPCRAVRRRWHKGLPHVFGCGCTLRTGAYVTAALSLVYAFMLAGAPWTLGVCGYRLCRNLDGGLAAALVAWVAAALLTLASLLMAIGAKTGRRELLLPWLGFSSLYVAAWLLTAFVGLIFIAVQGAPLLAAAAFFVSLNMAVLPLYFLVTVTALYVEIENQEHAAAERALGGAVVPAPASAHDHAASPPDDDATL